MPIISLNPAHPDAAQIEALISAHNQQSSVPDVQHYAFAAYDASGAFEGGVKGRYRPGAWAELNQLAVTARHKGVGTRLCQQVEAYLKAQNCTAICLSTLGNQAEGFYQKLGFTEYARLPGFAGQFDRIFMKKNIA